MLDVGGIGYTASTWGYAQEAPTSTFLKKWDKYKLQPIVGFQVWTTYTTGTEVFNATTGQYDAVDNRLNTQLRRSRFGIKGQPYPNLQFNVTAALDLVGQDVLTGVEAPGNNGGSPTFRVWNAYMTWKLTNKSEHFNLSFGYLLPQIGRESMTAALRSTSFEKAWSQNYLRRQLTGIGPGRAGGVNMGGIFRKTDANIGWGYDVGVFNPVFEMYNGNSTGNRFSPLVVGRFHVTYGDGESAKYSLGHKVNYHSQRKGITLGVVAAQQGATDLFYTNQAAGVDLLLNWKHLNIDGDWTVLQRQTADMSHRKVTSQTGYVRCSYNLHLANGYMLEPVAMWVQFSGEMDEEGQAAASAAGAFAGKDQTIDVGLNLYFNPDLKLSLHYSLRDGDAGFAGAGARVNNYFNQSGIGAIHRGDWAGLGLVSLF
ncbi:MAG: porin [Saprospiraceae bacterium]